MVLVLSGEDHHARRGQAAREHGIEIPLLGKCSTLEWAGSLSFVALSVSSAQKAINRFTGALHRKEVQWKPPSMQDMLVGRHGEVIDDALQSNIACRAPMQPSGHVVTSSAVASCPGVLSLRSAQNKTAQLRCTVWRLGCGGRRCP